MASNVSKRPNPRRENGAVVYAKACNVTSHSECHRRFGSKWKTKEVCGIVTAVSIKTNEKTNRQSTHVFAEFKFGKDVKKFKRLNIRSVRSQPSSSSFRADNVHLDHPVLNNQNLHPTSQATIMASKP